MQTTQNTTLGWEQTHLESDIRTISNLSATKGILTTDTDLRKFICHFENNNQDFDLI